MPLRATLSSYWQTIQGDLFPCLREALGPLSEKHKQVITVIEVARIEAFVSVWRGLPGRPLKDHRALSRAFAAYAVLGLPQTNMLIERLCVDKLATAVRIPKSGRPAEKSRDEHYCRSCSHHGGCNPAYVFQIPVYFKSAHDAFVCGHQHHDGHHRSGYDTIDDSTPE